MKKANKNIGHFLFRCFIFVWNRMNAIIPDELFLRVVFRYRVGYWPNLKNPQTYNEKLQWLKLHDKKPEYSQMVDKIEAKVYVASIIGEEFIIPTLGTWNSVEEIDWESLPNKFVIKVTSDSGGIVVCKDKSKLDIDKAIAKLKKNWGRNYYKYNKEFPYKNVKPRILAEKYISDENDELIDYKIYCFNGVPKLVMVSQGRFSNNKSFAYMSLEWTPLDFTWGAPKPQKYPSKPKCFSEMIEVAAILSKKMAHLRVDLYNIDGKIFFGELTFFDGSGMESFNPIDWDYKMGEFLKIPRK